MMLCVMMFSHLMHNRCSVNRQWMYADRLSNEYIQGVHSFLNVVEANMRNGFMCCPCRVYRNEKDYSSLKTLHIHLIRSGFMSGYNCWTKHGERGVMMEDNEEEENDDNYSSMFPEYGGNARGELRMKRHQMSPW